MADTVFQKAGVNTGDLKAVDNSDGTYLMAVQSVVGTDPTKDTTFDTGPPIKAVYIDEVLGVRRYAVSMVLI